MKERLLDSVLSTSATFLDSVGCCAMSAFDLARSLIPRQTRYIAFDAGGSFSDPKPSAVEAAFATLSKYFPAEIMSIYLLGVSIEPSVVGDFRWFNTINVYMFCTITSPIASLCQQWLISSLATLSIRSRIWVAFCSLIAFAIWGLAVPGNPLIKSSSAHLLVGFGAACTAFFLDLGTRAFLRLNSGQL
ncbi:hypothetical protein [Novosphingobium sp.]|uniref:hypothetical protein n=1 Tax=Novosphingobium sp. TaxID=1874826 RepID=UPI0038B82897